MRNSYFRPWRARIAATLLPALLLSPVATISDPGHSFQLRPGTAGGLLPLSEKTALEETVDDAALRAVLTGDNTIAAPAVSPTARGSASPAAGGSGDGLLGVSGHSGASGEGGLPGRTAGSDAEDAATALNRGLLGLSGHSSGLRAEGVSGRAAGSDAEAVLSRRDRDALEPGELRHSLKERLKERAVAAVNTRLTRALDSRLQGMLLALGGEQSGLRLDSSLRWDVREGVQGGLDVFVPFFGDADSTWFLQPGFLLWPGLDGERRHDLNIGGGYRRRVGDGVAGGGVFYDHNVDSTLQRLGLSLDFRSGRGYGALNVYYSLTDWEDSGEAPGQREEHALGGLDLQLHYALTEALEVHGSLGMWEHYEEGSGEHKGLRPGGSFGVDYELFPGLSFGGSYEIADALGKDRYELGLRFVWPAQSRLRAEGGVADLYSVVKREKRILYARRDTGETDCGVELRAQVRGSPAGALSVGTQVEFSGRLVDAEGMSSSGLRCVGLGREFLVSNPVEVRFRDRDGDGGYEGAELQGEPFVWRVPAPGSAGAEGFEYDVGSGSYTLRFRDPSGVIPESRIRFVGGDVAGDNTYVVAVSAGVSVVPQSLTVDEGGSGVYTVQLNSRPEAEVSITVLGATGDVTVSGSPLSFDASNWRTQQTVTVTAGGDADAEDDRVELSHRASSGDSDYAGVEVAGVTVTVRDDETAGVTLSTGSLSLSEGGSGTYTVVLATQPLEPVTVTPRSDNADVSFSPATLRFGTSTGTGGWDTAQTVRVTAEQDVDAADERAQLTHAVEGYGAVTSAGRVTVTVTDDETAGVTVTPRSVTVLEGDTAGSYYTVVLSSRPSAAVTVTPRSDNTDVVFTPATLRFGTNTGTGGWDTAQTVVVTARDDEDAIADSAMLTHGIAGGDYAGVSVPSVSVTVTEDDMAGVRLSLASLTVTEGRSEVYTVVLATRPSAAVTVTPSSDDADVRFSPATLSFGTGTGMGGWDTAQTVVVSAEQDLDTNNDSATLSHSITGGDYASVSVPDVEVTVTDDDVPGVTLSPQALTVPEGGSGSYTVVLNTQPSAAVTVTPSSDNADVSFSPATLSFGTSTGTGGWDTAQTVRVTAEQDGDAVDDSATLGHGITGGNYASVSVPDVRVTVTDDDTRGVRLSASVLTVAEGGSGNYTVVLATEPSATVTVTPSSDNADVRFSPATLSFGTGTGMGGWDTAQTVTVTAEEDLDSVNDSARLTHRVAGGDYASVSVSAVRVTVTDNDTPGVTLNETTLTVDEGDATGDSYTVVLNTQPSAAVTVTPSSNNADVEFTPATLSFSTSSGSGGWDTAQTVTVTAVTDADTVNDSATLTHTATSSDRSYNSVRINSVAVTVTDTTPGQPTGLTATAGDTQVELSWTAPVSGGNIGSWQYRATTETSGWVGASWMAIAGSDSTTTRHTVESLTNNSAYRFQVRAVGSVGTDNFGAAAAEARATPVAALPELTLSGTADGTEGGSLSLSLSSDIDVGGTLAVSFSVQGSTSATDRDAAAADFNGGTLSGVTTASFNNGKTAMVSLRLTDDASVEGAEGFRISLVAGTGYTVASGSAVLSGTLTDNDGIRLTAETSKGVTERGTLSVALSAVATSDGGTTYSTDADFGGTLSGLSWSYSGDAVAADFSTVPSSASFSDGTASVDFVVKEDSDSEESYSIQLSAVTGHTVVGSNAVSGKLGAIPTFEFASATATVTEGDVLSLTVNASPTPVEDIILFIDTTDGTAKSPADYTSGGYSLAFGAGVSSSNLFIQSAEDTLVEGDETFTAMLTGSNRALIAIIGDPDTVTVTIEDDDTAAAGVRLSATTLTVDEGDGDGGSYTVVLATQPDADVTVTVGGTLGDVTVSGSPLTFTSGTDGNWNTAQTVTVTAAVDSDTDNDSVTLTHSVSGGATGYGGSLSIDSVAVTVTDTTPGAAASLSAVAGDKQVMLTWGLPVSGGSRASWQYRQKAGSNAYGAWTPVPSSNAGTTSYTVSGLTNDSAYRFQVRAVGSVGTANYGVVSAEASATPRAAPVAGVTVNPQSLTVDEGDSNGGTYTVVLATQPSAAVTVTPSSNNADVKFTPATLSFATGTGGGGWDTAQTVTVTADADADADNDSATLTHGITGGDYATVNVPDVSVMVTDTTPELTLETAPSAVAEGAAISVTVTSDKNVSGTLSVSLTLADRGSSGFTADDIRGALTQTFTTASFGGGKTAAVTIATVNDAIVEGAETYTITLGSGTGYALGDDVAVDGTLNDNDSAQVTLASGTIAVTEGQTLTVPVTLSAAADTVVNGRVTLSDGTPTADFAAAMVNFSIAAGDTGGNASFAAQTPSAGDSRYNAPRSYTATVTLTSPPAGVTVGSDATDTVTVTDNTAAPSAGVRLSETTLTVDEGDATGDSYTVVLATQPDADVTVTVSGFGSTDVRATPALLTFGTGTGPGGWNTAQTVTVTAVEDSDADDEAEVTLTHAASGATGYGGGLSIASVAVTVTDTTPVLTLPEDPQTVREGTNIILDIRSDKAVSGTLAVSLTLSDRGASNFAAADITGALTQSFTTTSFRGGMTAIVSIPTVNDVIVEGAETYRITLGTGTGYVVGSDSMADGTLNDDDRARLTLASTEAIAVTEGQSLTVPVTMDLAVDTVVNGRVTLTGVGGSTPTDDFALAMVDFSISAGNTSASVVFLAKTADAGDGNYNAARSYTATLTLMDPPDDVFRGSDRTDTVTVTDNSSPPTPGVTLNRSSLTVTEEDTTGVSYTVVLNTAPTADVTVTVSSAAIGDVTATPATLTFGTGTGPGGWSTAQSVKVTAGDDSDADNDSVTLTHTASSSDTAYEGVSINSVMVTVTDNDTAGVRLSETTLTVTEEDTTGDSYTVVLATRPDANVTVTVAGFTGTDVTATPAMLTFGTGTGGGGWATAQTVKVTAGDDANASNESVTLTHAASGATGYGVGLNIADVEVSVTDNDTAGVTLSPRSLTVDEGSMGSYTVVLDTEPSAVVTVTPSSNNADVTFSPATLRFGTGTGGGGWDTEQSVTVTARSDADADNDSATLTHGITGGDYARVDVPDVSVTVTDTTPELTLATAPSAVSEGTAISVTVTSDKDVTGTLAVRLTLADRGSSGFTADDITGALTRTFTTASFGSGKTAAVTIATVDDAIVEGAETYTITLGSGTGYALGDDVAVDGTLNDNDSAEVTLASGTITVTEGQTLTVPVTMSAAADTVVNGRVTLSDGTPTDDFAAAMVNFSIAASQTSGNAVFLPKTANNGDSTYNAPRSYTATVTLTSPPMGVTVGSDATDTVTVTDNTAAPRAGVRLSATTLTVDEGDSAGGTYTVVLATQPDADVTVTVSSAAIGDVTVSGSPLTFTSGSGGNWNMAQTVTVTAAVDSDTGDDSVTLTHSVSGGATGYGGGLSIDSVAVTVTDTTPGAAASLSAVAGDAQVTLTWGLPVSGGTRASWQYRQKEGSNAYGAWTAVPSSNAGTTRHTVSSLTNGSPYRFQVRAVGAVGTDNFGSASAEASATPMAATSPGVRLSATTLTVDEGDSDGGTYTVVLATQPDADVTVTVGGRLRDVSVDPTELTFASSVWDTAQTVTVTAAVDSDTDDDSVTLTHSVSGGATGYGGRLSIDNVAVTVTDTTPGQPTGLTATAGDAQVELSWTAPGSGGSIGSWQYRATPRRSGWMDASWTPVPSSNAGTTRYTVESLNNNRAYRFQVRAVGSVGTANVGMAAVEASATPVAATPPGVTVRPQALTVDEGDSNGETYTVVLDTEPSAVVTVTPSSDNAEVIFSPATLRFGTGTGTGGWDTAQSVTVTARSDADADDDSATLTHSITGGDYATVNVPDVRVTVTDTTPKLTLRTNPSTVAEGTAIRVTVSSNKDVTGTLSVSLTLADRGSSGFDENDITGALTQTFTTASFGSGKTATVTIPTVDDAIVEGAEMYRITLVTGTGYALGGDVTVNGTLNDNDRAQVTLASGTIAVTEGQTLTVPVTMSAAADTVVNGQVRLSGGTPTDDFAAARMNFSITAGQTSVNVSFVAQNPNTGNSRYNAARSYTATVTLTRPPVGVTVGSDNTDTVTVTDNMAAPSPGVTLSETSLTVNEGDPTAAIYTVVLNTQPTAPVTVTVSSNNNDVRLRPPAPMTFGTTSSRGGWNRQQTVRVTARSDADTVNDSATLTHTASSTDNNYNSVRINSVAVTVTDTTPELTLATAPTTVTEGTAISLAVNSDKNVTGTLTVRLRLSDRGSSGFTADDITGGLTRNFSTSNFSGGTTATVTIATVDDAIVEGAETYTITLLASTGYALGDDVAVDGTLNDDDSAQVTLGSGTIAVTEGQTLTVPVTMSAAADTVVNGQVTLSSGTPTDDFAAAMVNFSIRAGETSRNAVFMPKTANNGDSTYNAPRSYTATVTLTTPPARVTVGSDATDTVTVTDNTPAPVPGVSLSQTTLSVDEGDAGGGNYTVVLNTQPSHNVTVTVSSDNTDVSASPASLTFTSGAGGNWNTERTVTVTAQHDLDMANDSATLTHTASSSDNDYQGVTINSVAVTVTDDDTREPVLQLLTDPARVNEGSAIQLRVTANQAVAGSLALNLRIADRSVWRNTRTPSEAMPSGTDASDFPGGLTQNGVTAAFNGGTTATVSIATGSDSTDEGDDYYRITLVAGSGYTVGTDANADGVLDEPSTITGFIFRAAGARSVENSVISVGRRDPPYFQWSGIRGIVSNYSGGLGRAGLPALAAGDDGGYLVFYPSSQTVNDSQVPSTIAQCRSFNDATRDRLCVHGPSRNFYQYDNGGVINIAGDATLPTNGFATLGLGGLGYSIPTRYVDLTAASYTMRFRRYTGTLSAAVTATRQDM